MSEETPTPSINICDLTAHLCRLVVKSPDQVQIKENRSDHAIIVTAQVADDDIGRVIGKQGSTIRAIRHLLDQVGRKNKLKVYFEIKNKPNVATRTTSEEGTTPKEGASESSASGSTPTSEGSDQSPSGESTSGPHPS